MSDQSEGSGSENYEVEGIIGHKDSTRSGRKYEIKWKGYKETTYEPRENLVPNAENLVTDYDKKHPIGKRSLRKEKPKPKNESKSRKSKRNNIDNESEATSDDEATDSNIENWKPNVKANRKRTSSKRVKSKIGDSNSTSKTRLSNSKKRVKVTKSSQAKKRGRSRITTVKSSSDEEYDVDILLDHRDDAAKRMYLVKWEGYRTSEATWEPSSNLSCKQLVRQYEHIRGKWKRPRSPRGEDEKTPTKRVRTSNQGKKSDHEEKEKVVEKPADGVEKVETLSKESEGDKATAEAVTEIIEGEKLQEVPKSETHKKQSKQDSNMVKSKGEEKTEKKSEGDADAETREVPDEKKEVEGGKSEDKSLGSKKSEGVGESTKIVD